ncbi:hypothetical protein [Streptomyces sp. NPDC092295]|uniref:hypothetical protein n=1 Tax=Streptomyces sp. NPDC092295 TaxID=3366011 RepID=UPI00381B9C1B
MDRKIRAGRLAALARLALNGFLLGVWRVHIPGIEERAGAGHAVLGRLLPLLGDGAFAGMRAAGPPADRSGARTVVPPGAAFVRASASA